MDSIKKNRAIPGNRKDINQFRGLDILAASLISAISQDRFKIGTTKNRNRRVSNPALV